MKARQQMHTREQNVTLQCNVNVLSDITQLPLYYPYTQDVMYYSSQAFLHDPFLPAQKRPTLLCIRESLYQ